MMEVDDVIARHRARLDEHRKFLENTAAGSPAAAAAAAASSSSPDAKGIALLQTPTPQGMAAAEEAVVLSPQPVDPTAKTRRSSSPPSSPFAAYRGRNPTKLQRCQSANHCAEEGRLQRLRDTYVNQALALDDIDAAHRRRAAQLRSSSKSQVVDGGFGSRKAPSAPAVGFFGYTGMQERLSEEDHFFENQLRAAGRFYVTDPDAMYIKSQMWLEGRERSRQQLQRERMHETLNECSFRPKLKASVARTRRSCSTRTVPNLSEDPSISAHLERLEEARQQRAEIHRRMKGRTAGTWTNHLTVPKAFEFARRVTAIPALRKPLTNAVPLHDDDAAKDLQAGERGHTGERPCSENVLCESAVCHQTPPPPKGMEKKEEQHTATGVEAPKTSRNATATRTASPLLPLKKAIVHLKGELAEKDRLVQEQKGEIALLRRQLEAARAVVRSLSLQDVSQET